jgi:hypothetical protein
VVDISQLAEDLSGLSLIEAKELASLLRQKWWPAPKDRLAVISIGNWASDDDNPVYPVGANPKRLLICPTPAPRADLIAGHRYLFKTPKERKAGQLWSELIAFHLSKPTGVHVPRCFAAMDERTGEAGALVEFFLGYPDDVPGLRLIHGSDVTQAIITDKKKGRPHSIRYNVSACRTYGITNSEIWWGSVLAFDALIGNTDRHPDNWGLLVRLEVDANPKHALAPAGIAPLNVEIGEAALPALSR